MRVFITAVEKSCGKINRGFITTEVISWRKAMRVFITTEESYEGKQWVY